MVEKFEAILSKIKQDRGDLILFAIVKMDELTDKWTIILSADWISDQNKTEMFNYLRTLLINSLTSEELNTIARMGLFASNEYLVQAFLRAVQTQNTTIRLQQTKINGFDVHEAYIFESKDLARV